MHKIFQKLEAFNLVKPELPPYNFPSIVCNEEEKSQQKTLASLEKLKTSKKTLHIGIDGFYDLDVIATYQPEFALITNPNPWVSSVIFPLLKSTILQSGDRHDFINNFLEGLRWYKLNNEVVRVAFKLLPMKKTPNGFLSSDDNFDILKTMIAEERVFFTSANMMDPHHLEVIKDWVDSSELNLKTLYLSNRLVWAHKNQCNFDKIKEKVSALIKSDTQVIDALKGKDSVLSQRITLGKIASLYEDKKLSRISDFFVNKGQSPEISSYGLNSPQKAVRVLNFDEKKSSENSFSKKC